MWLKWRHLWPWKATGQGPCTYGKLLQDHVFSGAICAKTRQEIRRIGINYNQVVKAVNTLAQLRDKRGNAVISAHTIDGNLTDLRNMMISVLEKVDAISTEISDNQSSTH